MDLEFMKNKIDEWELQKQNCSSKILYHLLEQLLTSGENNISNYEKLLDYLSENREKAKKLLSYIDEAEAEVIDGRMDKYYDLIIDNSNELTQEQKDDLKKRLDITQIDKLIEEPTQQGVYSNIVDEILRNLNESHKQTKEFCLKNAETLLNVYKFTFLAYNYIEKFKLMKYKECLNEAFNFHDYGRWGNFKNETKNFLVSLNTYTGAVAQIAQFINIFDEDKNKENFYSSTENNILKLEQQLSALLTAEKCGEYLIEYFSSNKYNLPTINRSNYESLIKMGN